MAKQTEIKCPKCGREKLVIIQGDRNVMKCPDPGCGYQVVMK